MTSSSNKGVVVVVFGEPVASGLGRSILRHGWPILRVSTADQALHQLSSCRAPVVIVQVPPMFDGTVQLIHWLRMDWREIVVMAVGLTHHDDLERAVRSAGASCYLPGAASSEQVDQAVAALVLASSPAA